MPIASTMKRTIGLFNSACSRHSMHLEEAEEAGEAEPLAGEGGEGGADAMQAERIRWVCRRGLDEECRCNTQ